MSTIWQVGGHWYVGSPEHDATALELTIGTATEFTFGDYNFFCLGFYLDATVGPLVEVIAPFPYSIFGGTLIEIIIPQGSVLAATVAGGAAGAAAGLFAAEMGDSAGAQAGLATAAAVATAAKTAAQSWGNGCQLDLVFGNYFFTVYGDTLETVPDKHHHHDGVQHFHYAIQLLHSVTDDSLLNVQSLLVVANAGITLSATAEIIAQGATATIYGSTGLQIGATATLQLSGTATATIAAPGQISLVSTGASITLAPAAVTFNAATIYLNGEVAFLVAPFAAPIVPVPPPTAEIDTAMANLAAAVAAAGAAAAGGAAGHH
jgi:hypothetical protein